jgi:uncharacterized protein YjiS (DUF1127 family)
MTAPLEAAMHDVSRARSCPARPRQPTIFGLGLAAARELAWLIAAIAAELRIRGDMRQASAMDDRMLKDIGLGRCEIEYRVRYGSQQ